MTGITSLSLVCVPVTDQDASIDFYVGKLGLDKRTDTPFGGSYRWVEVAVGDQATGIALAPPPPDKPVTALETGITFQTDDIDALHAELTGKGVDVDAEIMRMGAPVPDMFWFRDPDGHSLLAVSAM